MLVGGGYLRRDANVGNGNEGGGQETATRARAMVRATIMTMTWTMATAIRLAADKRGIGQVGKGNGKGDEGGR